MTITPDLDRETAAILADYDPDDMLSHAVSLKRLRRLGYSREQATRMLEEQHRAVSA
jgi:hypothetical protein